MFYFIGFLIIIWLIGANIQLEARQTGLFKRPVSKEKLFLMAMFLTLFLIFASQPDNSVYGDIQIYKAAFNKYKTYSVSTFLEISDDIKDPFYYFCGLILSKLGMNFHGWYLIISFVYTFAVYTLISRFSSNIYISFIALIAIGNFGFSLSGMRQALALAFLMLSFRYLEGRKPIQFSLLVILASMFHSTALIFLIAYPVYHIRLRIRNLLLIVGASLIVILNARPLMRFYVEFIGLEEIYGAYLEKESSLSWSGVVIFSAISAFCIFFIMNGTSSVKYKGLCNLALVSLTFRILAVVALAELFRISLYFAVFDIIMIAEACTCDKNNKILVHIKTAGATLAMSAYYFVSRSIIIVNFGLTE